MATIQSIADFAMADDNGTAVLQLGNGHTLRLEGVDYTTLTNNDFSFFTNHVEGWNGNETLTGSAYRDEIYAFGGNSLLQGLEGNDRLYVEYGDNTLDGGAGNDTLNGGWDSGVDTFVFQKEAGAADVINQFYIEQDRIDLTDTSLSHITAYEDLTIYDDFGSAIIDLGDGQTIRLEWVDYTQLSASDFLFS